MRTVVITGASRGVGRAAAEAFAKEGCRLMLNCRSNFDMLEAVAAELRESCEVITVHGPFTKEIFQQYLGAPVDWNMPYQMAPDDLNTPKRAGKDNRRKLASNLAEVQETATGKEDGQNDQDEIVLINNGGISTFHLTQDVPDEEFAAMIDANLGTMFRMTRALIPYLLHAGGRILNVSSVWGVTGASMETVYSLTKGGVNAYTRALAKELAPNHIPVNALALGCVDTDMNGWMSKEDRAQVEDEIPFGRMATPKECAEMLLLLSHAPRYLTGQVIDFDGAWI